MDNAYAVAALWVGLAFLAAMIAGWTGLSVSLAEILVGVAAGNLLHLKTTEWISFLAGFGSGLLTFLAGAEIEPGIVRRHWRETFAIGLLAFFLPFAGVCGPSPTWWPAGGCARRRSPVSPCLPPRWPWCTR